MSKNTQSKKLSKNNNDINQNINNISSKQTDNKQYNVIINQNSTFNQDNSINIMLDGSFPYFQNYNNYQPNETESNKNQIYPVYLEQQGNKEPNDKNLLNIDKKENEINNSEKIKNNNKVTTPKNRNKKRKNYSPKNNKNKSPKDQISQDSTNKIDYRYIKRRPIKEMIMPYKNEEKEINKDEQLFWFATYDKLMKTKYLLKIFNYYNNKPFESHQKLKLDLKEKTLVIKDFEIYFYENSNKPFIRYEKGGTIYTKLYLLTLKQINQIFSYLNRIDYKINYDILNYLQRKGTFQIINDNSNEVILPYCLIYSLGKYMNINIYAFTNNIDYNIYSEENSFQRSQRISSYTMVNNDKNLRMNYLFSNDKRNAKMDNTNINRENFKLPNSKKIAKLIKIINLNYPDFSIDDIINYLIPENKYMNAITKINEIKNLFFFKKSNQNKIILSSMVRDTIKGISIQTPKSLLSSFCPAESIIENNSFKNSDLFQPGSKKYVIPIKDDYKFQTINTNEKDNNKTNPFIIYVCDNVQKINFTNDNQSTNINNISNNQIQTYMNPKPKQKNKRTEINHYIEKNDYLQTDINQQEKEYNKQNLNEINKNKTKKEFKLDNLINATNKPLNKKIKERNKIKSDKIGNNNIHINNNNLILSNKQKDIKMKRLSTDIHTKRQKAKYNNNFSDLINEANKVRKSYKISRPKFPSSNLNIAIRQLNKSIENSHNFIAINQLSKTSDINLKKTKSSNKTKLINRINMNKKENYFSDKYNSNL